MTDDIHTPPFALGTLVTLTSGPRRGNPHVVTHEQILRDGVPLIQASYCGSARWYVPEWYPVEIVSTVVPPSPRLTRARRILSRIRPSPDGWIRLDIGRSPNIRTVAVGHVSLREARR